MEEYQNYLSLQKLYDKALNTCLTLRQGNQELTKEVNRLKAELTDLKATKEGY